MQASEACLKVAAMAEQIMAGSRRLTVECSVETAPHSGEECEQVRCSISNSFGDVNNLLFHPSTVAAGQWTGLRRNIEWMAEIDAKRESYRRAQERAAETTARLKGIGPVTAAKLCERYRIDSCEALREFLVDPANRSKLAADPAIQASAGDVTDWLRQVSA